MTYDEFRACHPGTPVGLADGKFGSLIDSLKHISADDLVERAAVRVFGELVARFVPIPELVDIRRSRGCLVQLRDDAPETGGHG